MPSISTTPSCQNAVFYTDSIPSVFPAHFVRNSAVERSPSQHSSRYLAVCARSGRWRQLRDSAVRGLEADISADSAQPRQLHVDDKAQGRQCVLFRSPGSQAGIEVRTSPEGDHDGGQTEAISRQAAAPANSRLFNLTVTTSFAHSRPWLPGAVPERTCSRAP